MSLAEQHRVYITRLIRSCDPDNPEDVAYCEKHIVQANKVLEDENVWNTGYKNHCNPWFADDGWTLCFMQWLASGKAKVFGDWWTRSHQMPDKLTQ